MSLQADESNIRATAANLGLAPEQQEQAVVAAREHTDPEASVTDVLVEMTKNAEQVAAEEDGKDKDKP